MDFESGEVMLEALWMPNRSMKDDVVQSAMITAISNLYVSIPVSPDVMFKKQIESGIVPGDIPSHMLDGSGEHRTYTVRKGDTLMHIAKRFRVTTKSLVEANKLPNADRISIGQILKMPAPKHHMHGEGEGHERAKKSFLHGQYADRATGKTVNESTLAGFAKKTVERNGVEGEVVRGTDGQKRKISRITFSLSDKHLQIRAKQYYPLVQKSSERFGHDPSLIMAMIHTESHFNPMAASSAKAYGLMQLVPSSGGREAYKYLHGKDRPPSRSYLMNPDQNIELGTAYMKILKDRMFSGVQDPKSRLYCAVAAYNGGAGNVGRTFIGRNSVSASLKTINAMDPDQVFTKLKTETRSKETRQYVERVFERQSLYRTSS